MYNHVLTANRSLKFGYVGLEGEPNNGRSVRS